MSVVVDASFLTRALLASQRSEAAAHELIGLLESRELIVGPHVLAAELGTAIRYAEYRGSISTEQANRTLRQFDGLPMGLAWEPRWLPAALHLARRIGASRIYDCIYLACAEDFDLDLYTCDGRFVRSFGPQARARIRLVSA